MSFFERKKSFSNQNLIQMAINYIKYDQCHSGFPEMADPEKEGIEVTIKQDPQDKKTFQVTFTFMSTPSNSPASQQFQEIKITHEELVRLANRYLDKKEVIDQALATRETLSKGLKF